MFSSWFDHAIYSHIVAKIWQVQEYDDARILACSREHLLMPCSVNLKVNNAINDLTLQ
jgi:hypothetical protein